MLMRAQTEPRLVRSAGKGRGRKISPDRKEGRYWGKPAHIRIGGAEVGQGTGRKGRNQEEDAELLSSLSIITATP